MKNIEQPKFTLTGKINLLKTHEDSIFMIVSYRNNDNKYFSYPCKYKGELSPRILEELEKLPVVNINGRLISSEDNGKIELYLYISNFQILQAL